MFGLKSTTRSGKLKCYHARTDPIGAPVCLTSDRDLLRLPPVTGRKSARYAHHNEHRASNGRQMELMMIVSGTTGFTEGINPIGGSHFINSAS